MNTLDLERGIKLIVKAKEKNREDRVFSQWVAYLPHMTSDTFIPFNDYLDQATGKNIDRRPTDVILKELDDLERSIEKGGISDGNI